MTEKDPEHEIKSIISENPELKETLSPVERSIVETVVG